jgi:Tol biopolymer transport system component
VFLRKLDGSNDPVNLGQGKAMSLSPDGKWALALREGPPHQLVLLPTGSGDQRLLPSGEIVEYHYACWFPDGKQILFTGIEKGRGPRSYVQNISDGQMRPITEESITALLVSPDGNRLVVHVPDGGPYGTYYLTALDGTRLVLIPGLGLGDEPIRWSDDGRALYTRGSGDFDTNIYRIDLSTGTRKLWKEIEPDPVGLLGVEVKPGGILITPDGKSYVYTYWTFLDTLVLVEGLR